MGNFAGTSVLGGFFWLDFNVLLPAGLGRAVISFIEQAGRNRPLLREAHDAARNMTLRNKGLTSAPLPMREIVPTGSHEN